MNSNTAQRIALQLGGLSLIPMIWGVAEIHISVLRAFARDWIDIRFHAPFATLRYAEIILAVQSGLLWGFAASATGERASLAFKLAVVPALYAFLLAIGDAQQIAGKLAIGFVIVLALDYVYAKWGLTPEWWLRLRLPVAMVMIACLMVIWVTPLDLLHSPR